jgi:TRAP-type C4-dicarboxylate transport system permease small subunit
VKHIAYTLLTLAFTAFCGAILVASLDVWPPGVDRPLVTDTLLRWALALGVPGGFVGLGALCWQAVTTPEGKR